VAYLAFGEWVRRCSLPEPLESLRNRFRVPSEELSFVIHTGDLASNGNNAEDWDRFFEIERDLLRTAGFYPALGNHEREAPVCAKYFSFPEGNCQRYSFDWTNRKNELHFDRRVTCFASLATSDMGVLCQLPGKSIPK
jgi:hypothetical protein